MTKFTIIPIPVKVLYIEEQTLRGETKRYKYVDGWRLTIGRYFVAEHSRGLFKKGDRFIIRNRWKNNEW